MTDDVIQRHLRAVVYVPLDDAAHDVFSMLTKNVIKFALQFGDSNVARFTRLV